ncbi:MAG TPA: efflux RND transporter periplasmic adaptor subunit [Bacteroidota bacterium]|nr:efflux RND transporter periplasmic adaptor subunit [Bacteroidota bacterium]
MFSRKRIIIFAVVAAGVVIAALPKLRLSDDSKNASGSGGGESRISVKAYIAQPARLDDRILTSGTLIANEEVELRSEVSGKVTKIYFQEGSIVQRDQMLVKINDSELQAQLLREQYREELAKQREERQRELLKGNLISQQDYDVALNELNTVKAGVKLVKAQIEKTEIHAPFDGTIGLKYISEGSFISTTTRIASLQDVNPIKVDFSIPEKYAGHVQKGARIRFHAQGSGKAYEGLVYAVEPRIEQSTRTLLLRASSPNPTGELLPGSFAEVVLVLKSIPDALTIPAQALIPELSGQKVYIYKNGRVVSQKVETGIRTTRTIQVTRGIAPGDTVVTSGILQIRQGSAVVISEFTKEEISE